MLFKSKPIIYEEKEDNTPSPSVITTSMDAENSFIAAVLDKSIGVIKQGETKHFYSFGNFSLDIREQN